MDRQRLTITLKSDLLKRLDEIVDGVQIRNRSHAIEFVLSQNILPKISQAVILAGGEGVKMRPLTYEIPKALIPVRGRPLIEYTFELLRESGIREIILATGHLGNKIKEFCGNGNKYGISITYSEEQKALGTAGALKNAGNCLNNSPFIVINGDILTNINLAELINFHQKEKYLMTMVLCSSFNNQGYGTAQLRGQTVVQFSQKSKQPSSGLINAGIYICNPELVSLIPEKKKIDIDRVLPGLVQEKKLAGFVFEGQWFDISTPKNYEQAIKKWSPKSPQHHLL